MLKHHPAWFTYDPQAGAYYFAPASSGARKSKQVRKATVLLDLDADKRLLGIELILGDACDLVTASRSHRDIRPPQDAE